MKQAVKAAYQLEIARAKQARESGDLNAAFAALERAHILGQRYLIPHISTHLQMLAIGWRRGDAREVVGQVMRLLATVPGFVFGWIPKGNTGGANVSAVKPMPLPADLQQLLTFNVWRDVALRALILAALGMAAVGGLAFADWKRGTEAAQLEQLWNGRAKVRVADFGSTETLEVTPLVNWRTDTAGLRTEPGVSYLVKTDKHTILFDVGFNREQTSPSPLEHNMAALGVKTSDIDTIFFSHAHRDHLGGAQWEAGRSFSFGLTQADLGEKKIYAPVALTYPGQSVETVAQPRALLEGVASTGPIPRRLMLGRVDEQALIINIKGRGLVAMVRPCTGATLPPCSLPWAGHPRRGRHYGASTEHTRLRGPLPWMRLPCTGKDIPKKACTCCGTRSCAPAWIPTSKERATTSPKAPTTSQEPKP